MFSCQPTEIIAVVIAAGALFLTILQSRETIKSNKIAVRPNIDITFNAVRGSLEPHGFSIKNTGVGPAIIESISYYVDGEEIKAGRFEIWKSVLGKIDYTYSENFDEFHIVHLSRGFYLEAGQAEYLIKLIPLEEKKGVAKREFDNKEWSKFNRIGIKIVYSSMQNEYCSIHYTPANEQPIVRKKCS